MEARQGCGERAWAAQVRRRDGDRQGPFLTAGTCRAAGLGRRGQAAPATRGTGGDAHGDRIPEPCSPSACLCACLWLELGNLELPPAIGREVFGIRGLEERPGAPSGLRYLATQAFSQVEAGEPRWAGSRQLEPWAGVR